MSVIAFRTVGFGLSNERLKPQVQPISGQEPASYGFVHWRLCHALRIGNIPDVLTLTIGPVSKGAEYNEGQACRSLCWGCLNCR